MRKLMWTSGCGLRGLAFDFGSGNGSGPRPRYGQKYYEKGLGNRPGLGSGVGLGNGIRCCFGSGYDPGSGWDLTGRKGCLWWWDSER